MKQTAVEYLIEQLEFALPDIEWSNYRNEIDRAKEMERIQIIDASATAYEDMFGANGNEYGENYYNKKFNN
jgi:hypothetical protein